MDAILTKWVGLLITGLKLAAASIVGRVMAALGFTWANFTFALPQAKGWLVEQFAGLPANIREIIAATGVDVFMTLVISAILARMGMRMFVTTLSSLQSLIGQEQGA